MRSSLCKFAIVGLGAQKVLGWDFAIGTRQNFLHTVATLSGYISSDVDDRSTPPWIGTHLKVMNIEDSVSQDFGGHWPMGRWPDPILRRPADGVDVRWFGTPELKRACRLLQQTCIYEKAVGLAAQQCGVNARIVHLRLPTGGLTIINPTIVERSPEYQMRTWREFCLVLPPEFRATVLRDDWVRVEYSDVEGRDRKNIILRGESARAVQHELDHDRGILITDHVDLAELSLDMRAIEEPGHRERMMQAFTRYYG